MPPMCHRLGPDPPVMTTPAMTLSPMYCATDVALTVPPMCHRLRPAPPVITTPAVSPMRSSASFVGSMKHSPRRTVHICVSDDHDGDVLHDDHPLSPPIHPLLSPSPFLYCADYVLCLSPRLDSSLTRSRTPSSPPLLAVQVTRCYRRGMSAAELRLWHH